LLTDGKVFPSDHPRIMRMKESALRPGILETYITCLMMACDTNDRTMIESMVKAIASEYAPQVHPAPQLHPTPVAAPQVPAPDVAWPHLLRRLTSFRI
jgi:hypothetical protein